MEEGITQADLEILLQQNVLAAEQLRRIVAERLVAELNVDLTQLKAERERWNGNRSVSTDVMGDAVVSEG